jgi:predicted ester cyclase
MTRAGQAPRERKSPTPLPYQHDAFVQPFREETYSPSSCLVLAGWLAWGSEGKEEESMMPEGNEALARRFHMDIFQEGTLEAADEILSPEFVWHGAFSPGEDQRGPEPTKQVASVVISAFPDRRITHEDTIAEGDKVLIRWTMTGTQEGEFAGVAPTGRRMTLTGFDLFRIEGGKIVEMWQEADRLGMMQQLGVVPEPGQAGS